MLNTLGVKLKAKAVKKMVVIEGGLGEEKIKSMLTFDKDLTDEDIAFIAESVSYTHLTLPTKA